MMTLRMIEKRKAEKETEWELVLDEATIEGLVETFKKVQKGARQEKGSALQSTPLLEQGEKQMETSSEEKRLLTIAEFAQYLGIGQTVAREILKKPKLGYRVMVGRTVMINKKLLDEHLDKTSY